MAATTTTSPPIDLTTITGVSSLSSADVKKLTSAQISALSPTLVAALTFNQLVWLTATAMNGFVTAESMAALQAEFEWFSLAQLSALTTTQMRTWRPQFVSIRR